MKDKERVRVCKKERVFHQRVSWEDVLTWRSAQGKGTRFRTKGEISRGDYGSALQWLLATEARIKEEITTGLGV